MYLSSNAVHERTGRPLPKHYLFITTWSARIPIVSGMTDDQIPTPRPALTAKSAFVVHLVAIGMDTPETIQGRIEHITSGRSMRFASSSELIGFMQQTLAQT